MGAFGSPDLDALGQDTVLKSRLYISESPYMMVGDSYLAYLFPLEVFPFSGCRPPLPDNILLWPSICRSKPSTSHLHAGIFLLAEALIHLPLRQISVHDRTDFRL